MAAVPGVTRRLRDAVRDSKIRKDIPSKPYQKIDSSASEKDRKNRDLDGWRHHLYYGHHQVGRDFPRTTQDGVAAAGFNLNVIKQEGRQVMGFASSFDEVERWFRYYMEMEAPFLGIYRRNTESESIIIRFKRNLPVFDGFWHSEDLLYWIAALEDFFEETNPPEKIKCKIVWSKMKGKAYYWWKLLQDDRELAGKEEISSWPKMKKLIISRFSPAKCSVKLPKDEKEKEDNILVEGSVQDQSEVLGLDVTDNYSLRGNKYGNLTEACVIEHLKEVAEVKDTKCLTKFSKDRKEGNTDSLFDYAVTLKREDHVPIVANTYGFGNDNKLQKPLGLFIVESKSKADNVDNVGSEASSFSLREKQEFGCQIGGLQMISKVLVNNLVGDCLSPIVKRGNESWHASKDCEVKNEQNQQTHLKLEDIEFTVGVNETLMFLFDPGGLYKDKLYWFWQHTFLLHMSLNRDNMNTVKFNRAVAAARKAFDERPWPTLTGLETWNDGSTIMSIHLLNYHLIWANRFHGLNSPTNRPCHAQTFPEPILRLTCCVAKLLNRAGITLHVIPGIGPHVILLDRLKVRNTDSLAKLHVNEVLDAAWSIHR